jgi:hypothetical protein
MKIIIDPDIAKVVNFMVQNVRALELHRTAHALADLADFVWKPDYVESERKPFTLKWAEEITSSSESPQPSVSTPRQAVDREVSDHQASNGESRLSR